MKQIYILIVLMFLLLFNSCVDTKCCGKQLATPCFITVTESEVKRWGQPQDLSKWCFIGAASQY